jgi:CheY-like chemotaxis protein
MMMENHKSDIKQATLLVVEDESFYLHLFRDVLENVGYHVLTAPNGQEAYRTFLKFQPDLILSDASRYEMLEKCMNMSYYMSQNNMSCDDI